MNITLLKGYPDRIGRRLAFCGFGTGPVSYTSGSAGGDPIAIPGYEYYADAIFGSVSVSGTYKAEAMPSAGGPRANWKLRYSVVATGAEVANATNLSAETFQIAGLGGTY